MYPCRYTRVHRVREPRRIHSAPILCRRGFGVSGHTSDEARMIYGIVPRAARGDTIRAGHYAFIDIVRDAPGVSEPADELRKGLLYGAWKNLESWQKMSVVDLHIF